MLKNTTAQATVKDKNCNYRNFAMLTVFQIYFQIYFCWYLFSFGFLESWGLLCAKFWNFWVKIHREIICQSLLLLTQIFNCCIVQCFMFHTLSNISPRSTQPRVDCLITFLNFKHFQMPAYNAFLLHLVKTLGVEFAPLLANPIMASLIK